MKTTLIVLICLLLSQALAAQHRFAAVLRDGLTREPVIGAAAVVKGTTQGSSADVNGKVEILAVPGGRQVIVFSSVGYQQTERAFDFPLADSLQGQVIYLRSETKELAEVTITSTTRSSRHIDNIPTRIETIVAGELEEKAVMQPGNIRMLLTESTGIQTQQTSPVSGSASIRIQGLDGKYTQLLQDGFPLYSGFASGLSILQIPPLNLKRVEVIKGAASTLYGGGAIAGLVNLITKEPGPEREVSLMVNANHTGALDMSSFYSGRFHKTGLTVYAAGNFQKAYDNNQDELSDIPEFSRYTLNPRFFYYPDENATLSVGVQAGFEKRTGGDLQVIRDKPDAGHVFFEENNSNRYSTQTKYEQTFANKAVLTLKNSIGYFNRAIGRPAYGFEGRQVASFSEASYLVPAEKSEWIVGLNYVTDDFRQLHATSRKLNYTNAAFGAFGQNSLALNRVLTVESGLRIDLTNRQQVFALPRLSVLYKVHPKLTSRIGGGLGYKMPTVFSEESEERAFQHILPVDFSKVKAEESYGLNADLNYRTTLGEELFFSVNQMFFYTVIQKPLVLIQGELTDNYYFENANGNMESKGFETNIKLGYEDLSAYLGYTFIDATRQFNRSSTVNPLTSRHRINANLMYEVEEKLRLAYEVFYTGRQYLSSGERTRDFWVMGVSGEYKFKHFSVFCNFENFLDTRQSRWEPMYTGSIQNPQFREVYTPTDGFIFNGGFKLAF